MSELVPAAPLRVQPQASLLAPLTDPAGGDAMSRLRGFAAQGPVKRMLPWFLGVSALGAVALTWSALAPAPQRTLYSELSDSERAGVVDALDKASIPYKINNETGALTVNEDDLYHARMLVASNGALATPQSGDDLLDKLPMGASRELEGERLRSAREHDLQLTIREIDGVEAVRVHLAEGEKSVFVRDNLPPSASVMVRLAGGGSYRKARSWRSSTSSRARSPGSRPRPCASSTSTAACSPTRRAARTAIGSSCRRAWKTSCARKSPRC
jgi:flagellar M-ring protein FliF